MTTSPGISRWLRLAFLVAVGCRQSSEGPIKSSETPSSNSPTSIEAIPDDSISALISATATDDHVLHLQTQAIQDGKSDIGYWGTSPNNYTEWGTHSNRLIPIYTFGTRNCSERSILAAYTDAQSLYRDENKIRSLYGYLPQGTVNPNANYCDQTNIYDLQLAAAESGKKKYIFLVIFDGMDWQTTRAAAIHKTQEVKYSRGRGTGLHFQDYTANGNTEFGWMCTSPHSDGVKIDVNTQTVINPGGNVRGGYNIDLASPDPWTAFNNLPYGIGKSASENERHIYTDSSSSATSMTAGIKTFNSAVNVDANGNPVETIAHKLQQAGWKVGAVTSVPISHATPAAAYAHNVDRDDYQDLTRDLLGLPSVSHPESPLSGLDVLIGGGFGHEVKTSNAQGTNFIPGNLYFNTADCNAVDVLQGGKYVVVQRTPGKNGNQILKEAAEKAAKENHRLLGVFGHGKANGHLPFQTADGQFNPGPGRKKTRETYTAADLKENPSLSQMVESALIALESSPKGFWLMVEAGDVDWANHDNNLDNSIGAVLSGDAAVKTITDWVERFSSWDESVMIVTSDHGHYFHFENPELLIPQTRHSEVKK